ncbi:MAG: hypothetical protein LBF39_04205, partial [Prevotellaceae bacterium]|nr:hypothetical protein [Prevotellaceae bacterium]
MRSYFHCKFAILVWAFLHLSFMLSAQFSDGDGSAGDPFQISNRAGLEALANYLETAGENVHFRLTADIDLAGAEWTPIGTGQKDFRGKLHGGGHHIKNISVNATNNLEWIGLFTNLGTGAVIDSVHITGGEINVTDPQVVAVGALAGVASGSVTVFGCSNSARVNVNNGIPDVDAGGLIGFVTGNDFSLTSCVNTGTVTGSGGRTGGLVGCFKQAKGTISDSYSQALIRTDAANASAGGLVGYIEQSSVTLEKCYATGRVHVPSGSSAGGTGGLAGFVNDNNGAVTITKSVAAQDTLTGPAGNTHRIVGRKNSSITLSDNYA